MKTQISTITLVLIIAGINIFCTIKTNLLIRKKEISTLRALGMSVKNMKKMIAFEGLSYAILSFIIPLIPSVASLTKFVNWNNNAYKNYGIDSFMSFVFPAKESILFLIITVAVCLIAVMTSSRDLRKIYSKGDSEVKAIDKINLEIEPYKFTAIIGQSGSGKSSLLHCMAGLDKPTDGKVFMDDLDLYTLNDDKLSKIRREEFGFIFQSFNLIPVINVYENIILPISLSGNKVDKGYIDDLIDKLGLKSQVKKLPNELSGGQQQRVAIASALANKPSVIFADEPTGSLDSNTTKEVIDVLKFCVKEYKQTLVMITHNDEIAKSAECVVTISDGKVVCS
ncbi:MAG TPA: hypothetical protein DDY58_07635 [Terrisporobacter glycolicus]|nr:hypothetical protein [Terrisporobacter hibernicus]